MGETACLSIIVKTALKGKRSDFVTEIIANPDQGWTLALAAGKGWDIF